MEGAFRIITAAEGVRQCDPMPSQEDLDAFYAQKYFQANDIYAPDYEPREIEFFRDSVRRKLALLHATTGTDISSARALEVGVGEGWTLQVLHESGMQVLGVDYSDWACLRHNPGVRDRLIVGKPEDVLRSLAKEGERFDLVWLDNVLEHTPDPAGLLGVLRELSAEGARLVVEVPNDYSNLQLHLLENGMVNRPFWEAVPEHLSYFRHDNFGAFCARQGWRQLRLMSDFPIDLYLLNEASNYINNADVGKAAHRARLSFEEAFRDTPADAMLAFLEAAAAIGLGRNLIGVFEPS
jgi:SAM-dependent methyltransferase